MSVQYQNKYDFSFHYPKKVKTPIRDFMWCISPLLFTAYLIGASALLHVGISQNNDANNFTEQINVIVND